VNGCPADAIELVTAACNKSGASRRTGLVRMPRCLLQESCSKGERRRMKLPQHKANIKAVAEKGTLIIPTGGLEQK